MNAAMSSRFAQLYQRGRWLGIALCTVTLLAEGGHIYFLLRATQSVESIILPLAGCVLGIIMLLLWFLYAPGPLRPQEDISDQETSFLQGVFDSSGKEGDVMTTGQPLLPPGDLQTLSYPPPTMARAFVLPKEGDDPERCGDKYAQTISTPVQRYAVTDGVSTSFLPGKWAQIVATSFVEQEQDFADPNEFVQWLARCSDQWHTWVETEWIPEANKLTRGRHDWERDRLRGAQTTFVGCSLSAQELSDQRRTNVHVTAVGDASFFLVRRPITQHDQWQHCAFPLENSEDFDLLPDTLPTAKQYLQDAWRGVKKQTYVAVAGDVIILATDALAHWILTRIRMEDCPWPQLLSIVDADAFRNFVEQERQAGQMEVDDTTLMVIDLQ